MVLQWTLHICRLCIRDFADQKDFFLIPDRSEKQNLNLSHISNCLHSIYVVFTIINIVFELLRWHGDKEFACQCRRHKRCGFYLCVEKISCRKKWQPTPVILPEKLHRQRSLAGHSPLDHEESDMTEHRTAHSIFILLGFVRGLLW